MMKIKQSMSLLVWIQRSKAKLTGLAPISIRLTIDGEDTEIAIGEKVPPESWDTKQKCVDKDVHDFKRINRKINDSVTDLNRHFESLLHQYDMVTPLMVKNVYKGKPAIEAKAPKVDQIEEITLLDTFDEFIARFKKLVLKGKRSKGTLRQWRTTKRKVQSFLTFSYKQKDIRFADITPNFGDDMLDYLTLEAEKTISEATAKGYIKKTKQIIKTAVKKQRLTVNPIGDFVCGTDVPDIPPLEYHQVLTIYNKDFHIDRLNEVRDSYIFQCFTGFAYQDIFALSKENIVLVGQEKQKWLIKNRGKTGVAETVPVLPIIEQLIEKYRYHPKCIQRNCLMPIDSNTHYNGYLKEIAVLCGIDRELNTHLARHTFADIMLNLGVPLEDVSKMLGHKSIRTTQRYCRVRKERIIRNVNKFVVSSLFTKDGILKDVV